MVTEKLVCLNKAQTIIIESHLHTCIDVSCVAVDMQKILFMLGRLRKLSKPDSQNLATFVLRNIDCYNELSDLLKFISYKGVCYLFKKGFLKLFH